MKYSKILYLYFNGYMDIIPKDALRNLNRGSLLFGMLKMFKWLVFNLIGLVKYGSKFIDNNDIIENKVWLLIGTKNNRDSLKFIKKDLEESVFIALNKEVKKLENCPCLKMHNSIRYICMFPQILIHLYQSYGTKTINYIDIAFVSTGLYEEAKRILIQGRPKAIIFANDHVYTQRAFLYAAKELKIPTIYIQHASVSTYFPPIRFDLSLLEGEDSLSKYKQCGTIEGEVKLIGMPKFDNYFKYRNYSRVINNIAICANKIDRVEAVTNLIEYLVKCFPDLNISFRQHPADNRFFKTPEEINISDSKKEHVFEFLKEQDLIIAANTSIHLEATLLNVTSLYYEFGDADKFSDYYGFVKNNLVKRFNSVNEIISFIREEKLDRSVVYKRAKYYNTVVDSNDEGKSSEIAINYIKQFLS